MFHALLVLPIRLLKPRHVTTVIAQWTQLLIAGLQDNPIMSLMITVTTTRSPHTIAMPPLALALPVAMMSPALLP